MPTYVKGILCTIIAIIVLEVLYTRIFLPRLIRWILDSSLQETLEFIAGKEVTEELITNAVRLEKSRRTKCVLGFYIGSILCLALVVALGWLLLPVTEIFLIFNIALSLGSLACGLVLLYNFRLQYLATKNSVLRFGVFRERDTELGLLKFQGVYCDDFELDVSEYMSADESGLQPGAFFLVMKYAGIIQLIPLN